MGVGDENVADDEIFWVDGSGTISVPAAAKEVSEAQSGEKEGSLLTI